MLSKLLKADDCKKCKKCCKFFLKEDWDIPLITETEKNLQNFNSNIVYFHSKLWKINILGLNNKKRTACPFLDESRGCILKDNKPFECKIWPFQIMKRKKNIPLIALSKECSIINNCDKESLITMAIENKDKLFKVAIEYPEMLKCFSDDYEVILEFDQESFHENRYCI